ncbi:hypothetical protein GCM10010492_01770 [Saccharothrix mutabilis subsp. mutabilis]|uniref:Uncharacterized protein n=1 Tax=Saccharothrix mutabilis subsp. mutabilis TaxID=66855 RepID=A0ABN0SZZ1_9PSEU
MRRRPKGGCLRQAVRGQTDALPTPGGLPAGEALLILRARQRATPESAKRVRLDGAKRVRLESAKRVRKKRSAKVKLKENGKRCRR